MDLLTRFQLPHCHIKDIGNSIFSFLMSSRPSLMVSSIRIKRTFGLWDTKTRQMRDCNVVSGAKTFVKCRKCACTELGRFVFCRAFGAGTTLSAYGVSARRKNRSQNTLKPVLRIMAHECQSSLTTGAELAGESVSGWFSFCPAGFTVVCCAMGSVLSCAPLVPCGGLCTMTTFEGMGFFMAIVFYE